MYYIGIDIGGTKCAAALGNVQDGNIELSDKQSFPTITGKPYETLEQLLSAADMLLDKQGLTYSDISGIGISCGGPLDSKAGVVLSPPNLTGWDGIKAVSFFESRTGIKTRLQNDANACALAEWRFGAGKGHDSLAFLTFGTGLGAGLILDGRLYSGHKDFAGEVGHVRMTKDGPVGYGKRGSAEGYCSGGGIALLAVSAVKAETDKGITPLLL